MISIESKYKNKMYLRDFIIVAMITALPFLFFTYKLIPLDSQIWSSGILSINDEILKNNMDYVVWILFIKILTLSILSIWFITNPYIWRFIIICPIIIEMYKIYVLLVNLKWGYDYESYFIESLLISFPYLIVLLFLSSKAGFFKLKKLYDIDINNEINLELNKISKFRTKNYKLVKKDLRKISKQKENFSNKEYLTKLIELRDRLSI